MLQDDIASLHRLVAASAGLQERSRAAHARAAAQTLRSIDLHERSAAALTRAQILQQTILSTFVDVKIVPDEAAVRAHRTFVEKRPDHPKLPRSSRRRWANQLTLKIIKGLMENPRRLDTQACYDAPERASGHAETEWLR